MRLVLIRHGETEHNRGNITLGRADIPLNERGRAQAAALGASFGERPAAVYASPLSRAHDTGLAIANACGIGVTVEDDLIEMDVGELEHLTGAELRERYPEFLRLWLSTEAGDVRMPGGESLRDVQQRAWAAIARIRDSHPAGSTVVAVTHNFVILTVICQILGLPLGQFRRIRQGLASKTVLDVTEGGSMLLQLNDNAHLIAAKLADDLLRREARK